MAELIIASQSDFLAFIRDQAIPNGNLSIRGVARCCGLSDHKSLMSGGEFVPTKLGATIANAGFGAGELIESGFPPQAVWLCIEYYAFESRAKAPMAKHLARTFGAIGVMATLKELSGSAVVALPSGPSKELVAAREIREISDLLDDNPRLAQVLTDSIMNQFIERKQLTGTADQLRGVAEIAVEMGFKLDASSRVKLGQFIAKQGFESKKEKRLCNGVNTEINCYPDTQKLRSTIAAYFEH